MLIRLYRKTKEYIISLGAEVRKQRRETLKRIYLKRENKNSEANDFINRKMQSMAHSQNKSGFSRKKIDSNMAQRNFQVRDS